MKKLLNACLLLTSLLGYLEWGAGNHAFLFQTEYELLAKATHDPQSFLHPFVLMPLFGQLLLLITLFQKTPSRLLTYIGLACLGLLLLFIFLIGAMGMNMKILLSAVPFIITGILVLRVNRKGAAKNA